MSKSSFVEEGIVDLSSRMAMESSAGIEAEVTRIRFLSARTLKREFLMIPGVSNSSNSSMTSFLSR